MSFPVVKLGILAGSSAQRVRATFKVSSGLGMLEGPMEMICVHVYSDC